MPAEPAFYEEIKAVVNLLQVASWLKEDLERVLQDKAGISHAEYEVCMQLLQHGSRLPLNELAELALFSQSGITRLLDRLENKHLARRELSAEDRRLVYAVLTPQGRRRLESAMPAVRLVMSNRFGRHMSRSDLREFRRILLQVIRANGWLDERQISHEPPGGAAGAGPRKNARSEKVSPAGD